MKNNDIFFVKYLCALGTPFEVGDVIFCENKREKVLGYDWDFIKGLKIITESHEYYDYDIANELRRMRIEQFQREIRKDNPNKLSS